MREYCKVCWSRHGRQLWEGSCLCTKDVMTPTQFHKRSAKNVPKITPKEKTLQPEPTPVKERLVFGQKPSKTKKRQPPKKV